MMEQNLNNIDENPIDQRELKQKKKRKKKRANPIHEAQTAKDYNDINKNIEAGEGMIGQPREPNDNDVNDQMNNIKIINNSKSQVYNIKQNGENQQSDHNQNGTPVLFSTNQQQNHFEEESQLLPIQKDNIINSQIVGDSQSDGIRPIHLKLQDNNFQIDNPGDNNEDKNSIMDHSRNNNQKCEIGLSSHDKRDSMDVRGNDQFSTYQQMKFLNNNYVTKETIQINQPIDEKQSTKKPRKKRKRKLNVSHGTELLKNGQIQGNSNLENNSLGPNEFNNSPRLLAEQKLISKNFMLSPDGKLLRRKKKKKIQIDVVDKPNTNEDNQDNQQDNSHFNDKINQNLIGPNTEIQQLIKLVEEEEQKSESNSNDPNFVLEGQSEFAISGTKKSSIISKNIMSYPSNNNILLANNQKPAEYNEIQNNNPNYGKIHQDQESIQSGGELQFQNNEKLPQINKITKSIIDNNENKDKRQSIRVDETNSKNIQPNNIDKKHIIKEEVNQVDLNKDVVNMKEGNNEQAFNEYLNKEQFNKELLYKETYNKEQQSIKEQSSKRQSMKEQSSKRLSMNEQSNKRLSMKEQSNKRQFMKEQSIKEQIIRDQLLNQQSIREQFNTEKPINRKSAIEKPINEQSNTEKPINRKSTTEKPIREELNTEKPINRKSTTKKPIKDQFNTEKPINGQSTTEKPNKEQFNTEKLINEQLNKIQAIKDKLNKHQSINEQSNKEQLNQQEANKKQLNKEKLFIKPLNKKQVNKEQFNNDEANKELPKNRSISPEEIRTYHKTEVLSISSNQLFFRGQTTKSSKIASSKRKLKELDHNINRIVFSFNEQRKQLEAMHNLVKSHYNKIKDKNLLSDMFKVTNYKRKQFSKSLEIQDKELQNINNIVTIFSKDKVAYNRIMSIPNIKTLQSQSSKYSNQINFLLFQIKELKHEKELHTKCTKDNYDIEKAIKFASEDLDKAEILNENMIKKIDKIKSDNIRAIENLPQKVKGPPLLKKKSNTPDKLLCQLSQEQEQIKQYPFTQAIFTDNENSILKQVYSNNIADYNKLMKSISFIESIKVSKLNLHTMVIKGYINQENGIKYQYREEMGKLKEGEEKARVLSVQINDYKKEKKIYLKKINETQEKVSSIQKEIDQMTEDINCITQQLVLIKKLQS